MATYTEMINEMLTDPFNGWKPYIPSIAVYKVQCNPQQLFDSQHTKSTHYLTQKIDEVFKRRLKKNIIASSVVNK